MPKKLKNDISSWVFIIVLSLFFIEIIFFDGGILFFLLLMIGLMYIGKKRLPRTSGKIFLGIGLIGFTTSVFNLMTFKILLLVTLIYLLLHFLQTKKQPMFIDPIFNDKEEVSIIEEKFQRQPLLKNTLFGHQKTPEHVYEWNDINIQVGIGDVVIDLSNTVLPKGEAIISIRHFVGNVQLFVPYEIEVSVRHSVVSGAVTIFNHKDTKVLNETIQYQTPDYEIRPQKLKVITSMIAGNIEVKRI